MSEIFVRFDVDEETPVQWVGVHPIHWRPEWGEPTAMFREAGNVDIANIPVVKALADACRAFVEAWQKSCQLEKTDVALRMAKSALEPFTQEDK